MKRFSNKSSFNINESKRQRIGSSETRKTNNEVHAAMFDSDPFGDDDDDLTADDLDIMDRLATQVCNLCQSMVYFEMSLIIMLNFFITAIGLLI